MTKRSGPASIARDVQAWMRSMRMDGASLKQIQAAYEDELGLPTSLSSVHLIVKDCMPSKRSFREKAIALVRGGASQASVAARYGLHKHTVAGWCRAAGVRSQHAKCGPRRMTDAA